MPGLRITAHRINDKLRNFYNNNETDNMESLLQLTASIYGMDRRPFFDMVLKAYGEAILQSSR